MADPRREGDASRTSRTTGADQQDESTRTGTGQKSGTEQNRSGTERSQSGSPRQGSGQDTKTSGTDRDLDANKEAKNQGHGQPREERKADSRSTKL